MSKKSNLFKFVTLRNPHMLDEDRKEQGFVFHPDVEASEFYEDTTIGNPEQRYGKLKTKCASLITNPPHEGYISLNRSKLRVVFPKLSKFSSWFNKNKSKLNPYSVDKAISDYEAVQLTVEETTQLWDNLIYQTITNQSTPVRETIIQLLIANQYLIEFKSKITGPITADMTEFTEEFKEEFARRTTANVAVPNIFLPEYSKDVPAVPTLSSFLTKRLEKEMEAAVARERMVAYEESLHTVKIEAEEAYKAQIAAKNTVHKSYVSDVNAYREANKVTTTVTENGVSKQVITYPDVIDVSKSAPATQTIPDIVTVIDNDVKRLRTRTL